MSATMENSPAHIAAAQLLAIDELFGMVDIGTEWEINFIIAQMEQWIEKHQPRTASQLKKINEIYTDYFHKYGDSDMSSYDENLADSKLDFITGRHQTV